MKHLTLEEYLERYDLKTMVKEFITIIRKNGFNKGKYNGLLSLIFRESSNFKLNENKKYIKIMDMAALSTHVWQDVVVDLVHHSDLTLGDEVYEVPYKNTFNLIEALQFVIDEIDIITCLITSKEEGVRVDWVGLKEKTN